MFVVCGRNKDGTLRVMDTDDYTVESVTVEQVKVVQSLGYSVKFDESMDYIFYLYRGSFDIEKVCKLLLMAPGSGLSDKCGYKMDSWHFESSLGYLIFNKEIVVLVNIVYSSGRYTMFMNNNIRPMLTDVEADKTLELWEDAGNEMSVCWYKNGIRYSLVFDMECNYIRDDNNGWQ